MTKKRVTCRSCSRRDGFTRTGRALTRSVNGVKRSVPVYRCVCGHEWASVTLERQDMNVGASIPEGHAANVAAGVASLTPREPRQ